jgi:hypothetical protein
MYEEKKMSKDNKDNKKSNIIIRKFKSLFNWDE